MKGTASDASRNNRPILKFQFDIRNTRWEYMCLEKFTEKINSHQKSYEGAEITVGKYKTQILHSLVFVSEKKTTIPPFSNDPLTLMCQHVYLIG